MISMEKEVPSYSTPSLESTRGNNKRNSLEYTTQHSKKCRTSLSFNDSSNKRMVPSESPPTTPTKVTNKTILDHPLMASDHLEKTFSVTLQDHTTCGICDQLGHVKFHKGIEPSYPKGYYCCLNMELSSQQALLSVIDNGELLEVHGPRGIVTYIEEEDTSQIRNEITQLNAIGLRTFVFIKDFMKKRQCVSLCRGQILQFTQSTWSAKVCIYTRPFTSSSNRAPCNGQSMLSPTAIQNALHLFGQFPSSSNEPKNLFGTSVNERRRKEVIFDEGVDTKKQQRYAFSPLNSTATYLF